MTQFNTAHHRARRALVGLSAIALGGLALLDNLHVGGGALLNTYWPLVFVVWGVAALVWPNRSGSRVSGIVLIVVGALLTAHNVGYADFSINVWWPLFVILAGVTIVLRGLLPGSHGRGRSRFETATLEHADEVNIDTKFSGIKLRNDSRNFQGGRVDISFSGLELDLREAVMTLPEAVLQIRGLFSGIELRVPRDWLVVMQLGATFGGVEDNSVPPVASDHRLVLRGETIFGAVDVKN